MSRLAVVVLGLGGFDGETGSGATSPGGTIRDVSGDRRVAFVPLGSARRATAALLGFFIGSSLGSAIRPTALGVGVRVGTCPFGGARFLVGVDGPASTGDFRFGGLEAAKSAVCGGGMAWDANCAAPSLLRRADRLVAAAIDVIVCMLAPVTGSRRIVNGMRRPTVNGLLIR